MGNTAGETAAVIPDEEKIAQRRLSHQRKIRVCDMAAMDQKYRFTSASYFVLQTCHAVDLHPVSPFLNAPHLLMRKMSAKTAMRGDVQTRMGGSRFRRMPVIDEGDG